MITLNAQEQLKLDIIHKVSTGKIPFSNALNLLDCSKRTLYRYLKRYQTQGVLSVKHKNCYKQPANKICSTLEIQIVELCRSHYFDFNRSHARQMLMDHHQIEIAKNTFNRLCNRNDILKKNVKIKRRKTPRYRREPMKSRGLMIQLDGSPHRWFGTKKTCLVIAIDDSDSDIIYGEFSPTETTFACMNVIKQVIKRQGLFELLYVDKAGIHGKNQLDAFSVKRESFSQLRTALDKLNIKTIFAHSPQAKGRVERAFRTLQDRLIAQMRLNNIRTIKEANRYLNEVFLPKHRELFVTKTPSSSYIPVLSNFDYDKYFYMSLTRLIKNDHTFTINREIFDIEPDGNNYSGMSIDRRSYPDGKVEYFINNKKVRIKSQQNNQREAG